MPLLERAVAMSRERFGANDWRTGEAQLALGVCLSALGQPAKAEPLLREAAEKTWSAAQGAAAPRLTGGARPGTGARPVEQAASLNHEAHRRHRRPPT